MLNCFGFWQRTHAALRLTSQKGQSIHTGSQQTDFQVARKRHNRAIHIQLNPQKINSSVQAFVLLVVDQYSRVNELLEFVNAKENIVDCYAITGEYDYQLRLYARDITELESILLELKGKSVFPRAIRSLC